MGADLNEKTCTKCRLLKPVTEFSVSNGSVFPHCKTCRRTAWSNNSDETNRKRRESWKSLSRTGKDKVKRSRRAYFLKNKKKLSQKHKDRKATIRQAVIEKYGSKCACRGCTVTATEFLTIDHVNGDGAKERAEKGWYAIYTWLNKNPVNSRYRLLCYNCNCSRGHYDYCPHERPNYQFNTV